METKYYFNHPTYHSNYCQKFTVCRQRLNPNLCWQRILNMFQVSRLWQYGLLSFQTGDTNLERFLPKSTYPKEINPKLEIQNFSLGMLILLQKSFKFCTPCKKTHIPYCQKCKLCLVRKIIIEQLYFCQFNLIFFSLFVS